MFFIKGKFLRLDALKLAQLAEQPNKGEYMNYLAEEFLNQIVKLWASLSYSSLTLLALLLVIAPAIAQLLHRNLRVPTYTAFVAAGMLVAALLGSISQINLTTQLLPLLEAVTMVMLFEVGQRVSFSWLKRNPALLLTSLLEYIATFLVIFLVLWKIFLVEAFAAALVAAVASSSSPVVISTVAQLLRARGQVTERAILFATLSTIYTVLILQIVLTGVLATDTTDRGAIFVPLYQLCGSFLLGFLGALVLLGAMRTAVLRGPLQVVVVIGVCMLLFAMAQFFSLSPLLSALALGTLTRVLDRQHTVARFEWSDAGVILAIIFYVISGASLSWQMFSAAFGIALILLLIRSGIKIGVHAALANQTSLSLRSGILVGCALTPMSSVSLMLASNMAFSYPGLGQAAAYAFGLSFLLTLLGPAIAELTLSAAGEPTRRRVL